MRKLFALCVLVACSDREQGEVGAAVRVSGPPGPDWGVSVRVLSADDETQLTRKRILDEAREIVAESLRQGGRLVVVATAVDPGPKPGADDQFVIAEYDVEEVLLGKMKQGRIKVRHPLLPGHISDAPPPPSLGARYVLFLARDQKQSFDLRDALRETPYGYLGQEWPAAVTLDQVRQLLGVKP